MCKIPLSGREDLVEEPAKLCRGNGFHTLEIRRKYVKRNGGEKRLRFTLFLLLSTPLTSTHIHEPLTLAHDL